LRFTSSHFSDFCFLVLLCCEHRYPIEDSLLAHEPPPEVPLIPRPKAEGNGLSIALQVPLVALKHEECEDDDDDKESAEGDSETDETALGEEEDAEEETEGRSRGAASSSKRGSNRQGAAAAVGGSSHNSGSAQKAKKKQQLLVDNQEELLARAEALKASADALAWKREWCVEGAQVVHESYGTGEVASVGAAWIWVKFDDPAVMKKAKSKVSFKKERAKGAKVLEDMRENNRSVIFSEATIPEVAKICLIRKYSST